MRCIETYVCHFSFCPFRINYNMRCIETSVSALPGRYGYWINYNMRCIETVNAFSEVMPIEEINYNMRCIETTKAQSYS